MRKANPDNILRVKNFLDIDLFNYFKDFFLTHPYFSESKERALYGPHHYGEEFDEHSIFTQKLFLYKSAVLKQLMYSYGVELVNLSGTTLRKWFPGEYQDPHSDNEALITIKDDFASADPFPNFSSLFIEYAALVYFNDDYTGGEIFFPDYDIAIKPEPNEFISFPGNRYYIHGVKEMIDGKRFVMQDFVTTPRMMYLWQNFVVSEEDLAFSDKDIYYYMKEKTAFSRSNIPKYFIFNRNKYD